MLIGDEGARRVGLEGGVLLYVCRYAGKVVLADPRRRKEVITTISSSNFADVLNIIHARNPLFMRIARQFRMDYISMGDIHVHLIRGIAPGFVVHIIVLLKGRLFLIYHT